MSVVGDGIIRKAVFSPCGTWRYTLERCWDYDLPRALFVLLNSSDADAVHDDPTNRRGMGFARRWGYGSVVFVNLFAFQTKDPRKMKRAEDPVGPENDDWIVTHVLTSDLVVLAWGNDGEHRGRDKAVLELLRGYDCHTLGTNKGGQPKHPLYLRADTRLHRLGSACEFGCCASNDREESA